MEKIPSTAQLKNVLFLGLLYGAKGIGISNYFYNSPNEANTTALYNTTTEIYSPLWHTIKNEVSPLLKGTFGLTLKNLNQDEQYPNINIAASETQNLKFINKIEAVPNSGVFNIDLGFFTDATDIMKKYFMVVNRYYSNLSNLKYTFQNLTIYKNWEVTNLVSSIKSTIIATNNSAIFNDVVQPGDAGFYSILPVVKYGGTLLVNETISGTNTLLAPMSIASGCTLTINGTYISNADITVNSGGTLFVLPGATIRFSNGCTLVVNGTLNAIGTGTQRIVFDRNSSTGHWAGIIAGPNARVTLYYCNISNADNGYKCDNPINGPQVQNCNITNCYNGIYATNYYGGTIAYNTISGNYTGIYLYNLSPNIFNNNFTGNAYYGIYLDNYSSPYIYNNNISLMSGGTGILCRVNSSPQLKSLSGGFGYNNFNTCNRGIYAEQYSNPFLGNSTANGLNRMEAITTKFIEAKTNCTIWAQNNNWVPADPTKFSATNGSVIYWSSAGGPSSLQNNPDLVQALNYETTGQYSEALLSYEKIFKEQPNTDLGMYSLIKISDCFQKLGRNDIKPYLDEIIPLSKTGSEMEALKLELENKFLLQEGKSSEVLNNLKNLISNKSFNEETKKHSLYNSALVYLNRIGDVNKAKELFSEFKNKYPNDRLNDDAEILFNINSSGLDKSSKYPEMISNNDNIKEFELLGNYPNPFNPTTTIKYALPKESSVELKIYDIMGREIKSFVFDYRGAGYQNVTWNGTDNNNEQVSSGIYLYTIKAKSLEDSQTFSRSAKLLLIK